MSLINDLKKEIVSQIATSTNVQDAADYEKSTFSGYPAVTVTISSNDNEFFTTDSNMRSFIFKVRCYVQIETVPQLANTSEKAKEQAEAAMGDLVSELLEIFDKFYEFGGQADYMLAVPSSWGYVKIDGGWCRTAEIDLQVKKEFNYP